MNEVFTRKETVAPERTSLNIFAHLNKPIDYKDFHQHVIETLSEDTVTWLSSLKPDDRVFTFLDYFIGKNHNDVPGQTLKDIAAHRYSAIMEMAVETFKEQQYNEIDKALHITFGERAQEVEQLLLDTGFMVLHSPTPLEQKFSITTPGYLLTRDAAGFIRANTHYKLYKARENTSLISVDRRGNVNPAHSKYSLGLLFDLHTPVEKRGFMKNVLFRIVRGETIL